MNNIKNGIKTFILLMIILTLSTGCKNIANPEYTLTVILSEGTAGTPEAGIYTYKEFDTVDYNYQSTDENVQIEVLLNGNKNNYANTLTMYNNVTILVQRIDIRDTWEFSYIIEDGTTEKTDITFTGDTIFGGTFTDSRGYSGTWTVANDDLTITFNDWKDYIFTGVISSMTGNYTGAGISGTWSAIRKN